METRTKRLTNERALKLLRLEYGSQVDWVSKIDGKYWASAVNGYLKSFTREDILGIEDQLYSGLGC